MNYYRLRDNINFPNRWYLGDIIGIDNWRAMEITFDPPLPERLEIEVHQDGHEMDFSLTSAYGIPIVSENFRKALENLTGFRFIPVKIRNKNVNQNYFVFVIANCYSCIDEINSTFSRYAENDSIRPDKAGKFSGFYKMLLDKNRKYDANIFRVKDFEIAMIVDEKFKRQIENHKELVGWKFIEV